jgi:subtilisin family serine protease
MTLVASPSAAPEGPPVRLRSLALLPVLAAVVGGGLAAPAAASPEARPYIVVLKDDVAHPSNVAAEHRRNHGAAVTHTYEHALKGYAASLTAEAYGEIMRDRRVKYVEPDGVATTQGTQLGATWGLDRIDQAGPVSTTPGNYTYAATGTAVIAYVIDTGIRFTHGEFDGRAVTGYDAVDGGTADDCNGHGTHVAGTVGGELYGVAKGVQLVGVRVLDCAGSGSWSGVIEGIDWVTEHHDAAPAVANMSLGGGANSAVDDAVRRLIADGVTTVVAAGNGNMAGVAQDACKSSPARVAEAITIGATDKSDKKTSWSNYGKCVDWFAPGAGITSAWYQSDTQTNTISGTSMASPHVAGVAALHLAAKGPATPAATRQALYDLTTKTVVTSSKTANNHLLFTNY